MGWAHKASSGSMAPGDQGSTAGGPDSSLFDRDRSCSGSCVSAVSERPGVAGLAESGVSTRPFETGGNDRSGDGDDLEAQPGGGLLPLRLVDGGGWYWNLLHRPATSVREILSSLDVGVWRVDRWWPV